MLNASEKPTDLVVRSFGRSICIEQCEGRINNIVQARRLQSQGWPTKAEYYYLGLLGNLQI